MLKICYLLTWIYCGCSSKIDRPRISLALICTYDYTYLCKAWKNYDAVSVTNTLTVFPQIRPAGIIFLLGVQLRVLLERGYYSRASINFSMCKFEKIKPANIVEILHKFPRIMKIMGIFALNEKIHLMWILVTLKKH